MGLFDRLFGKADALVKLPDFLRWPDAKSGVSVSWSNALEVTAALACVERIADGVAQATWQVMRRLPNGGSEPYEKHDLYWLLYRQPNGWQTSFEFRKTICVHRALCGNAFVYLNKVDNGRRIIELIPIEPGRVTVTRQPDMSLRYRISSSDGREMEVPQDQMWHLRGTSWNSWMGMETVKLAREAIGLAMATEATHARLHKNGSAPGGLYSVEGNLNEKQYQELQKFIMDQVTGDNQHKPLILDRKGNYVPTSMTGVDQQHLETRRFQIEEICRAFGVIPMMIGVTEKTATYASAEQMFIAHVVHTLGPWYASTEQSADVKLIGREPGVYTKFNPDVLIRGSMEAEASYFSKALGAGGGAGWMTPNQIRTKKDWEPVVGGDELPKRMGAAKTNDDPKEVTQ